MSPAVTMLGLAVIIIVLEVAEYKTGFLSKGAKAMSANAEKPVAWDTEAGERLMAEANFGVQCMTMDRIKVVLGPGFEWVTKKALEELLNFINVYSKAGFLRTLAFGAEDDLDVQEAAFLLCYMLEIKYENLWKNCFMEREDVEDYIELVEE